MAEENNEDDSWLYGSSNENQENQDEQPQIDEQLETNDTENEKGEEGGENDEYQDDQHVSETDAIKHLIQFHAIMELIVCRK